MWFTTACYAKLGGVPGQFLLRVKRGETAIVRTGDYNADTNVLGSGQTVCGLARGGEADLAHTIDSARGQRKQQPI